MKKWLLLLLMLGLPSLLHAQYNPAQGWCEDGNIQANLSGLPSTNTLQGSYPLCTVTVLIHGGGTATIYSTATGTPLANPFTANANGQWQYFASAGIYDVTLTGGTPIALPAPVTFSYVIVVSGTGSVTSFSSGNLSPIFTTSVATATTTPAQSFSLSTAAANTVLGNCTGSTAAPTYCSISTAMLPAAPGSDTQMIYNSSGAFAATTGLNWDSTNRRLSMVDAGNTAHLSLQPGTISFNAAGGTTAPYISAVFNAFDFVASAVDMNFGQAGNNHHMVLPNSDFGMMKLGDSANAGTINLNDGTSSAGVFQGPIIRASNASPEGSITGRIGSLYLRTNGSNVGTVAYLKESGTSNTGWSQFAMQDDVQTLTNKALSDTSTLFVNAANATKTLGVDLSGATAGFKSTLAFVQTAARTYTYPDASGTVCLVASGCPPLYDHSGSIQATAHMVQDTCVLGTSCSVTLAGSAVFTSSTSYTCVAQDQTATAATKVAQSSGSAFAITGTGTDTLRYTCIGN